MGVIEKDINEIFQSFVPDERCINSKIHEILHPINTSCYTVVLLLIIHRGGGGGALVAVSSNTDDNTTSA